MTNDKLREALHVQLDAFLNGSNGRMGMATWMCHNAHEILAALAAPLEAEPGCAASAGGAHTVYDPACKYCQQPVEAEPVAWARGYAKLGIGAYLINHSAAGSEPELVITFASEEDRRTHTVGDSIDNEPGGEIQPEEMIVRLGFANEAGLAALEAQLQRVREVHFAHPAEQGKDAEDAAKLLFMAHEALRCHSTKNPCGTDTWMVGHDCQCAACQCWLRNRAAFPVLAAARNAKPAKGTT